jgi:hypothetical protein
VSVAFLIVILSVIMQRLAMTSIVIQSVIMLGVIMLSVVAPLKSRFINGLKLGTF